MGPEDTRRHESGVYAAAPPAAVADAVQPRTVAPFVKERRGRSLSVVIPLYNEERSVPLLLSELFSVLEAIGYAWEVVVVDDGSSDRTWTLIGDLAKDEPRLKAVLLSRTFGKEAALCAGLDMAGGDGVIVMDGDLQHPPRVIPRLVRAWEETGADVIDAVKSDRGRESIAGRLLARGFYRAFDALSGLKLDSMADFKLLDRRVVEEWRALPERNRFFRGLVEWLGFRHAAVEFEVADREGGASRWSLAQLVRLATTAITSFSTLPIHFATATGFALAGAAVILGVQTLYRKLAGEAVAGFTTVILVMLIIGSALLISVGIIGEYVARIYHEVKRRPNYIVRERIDRQPR